MSTLNTAERIRSGSLKPPALGEGIFTDGMEAFLLDVLTLRCNRRLFFQMLMLLEYLRLKQAVGLYRLSSVDP
jgi:hypothetical protein